MEQKWFFLEIVLKLMEELIFLVSVPVLRDRSSDNEVDNVRVLDMARRCSSGNVSLMSSPLEMWRRDKWSAIEFSLPFLSFISKSNS